MQIESRRHRERESEREIGVVPWTSKQLVSVSSLVSSWLVSSFTQTLFQTRVITSFVRKFYECRQIYLQVSFFFSCISNKYIFFFIWTNVQRRRLERSERLEGQLRVGLKISKLKFFFLCILFYSSRRWNFPKNQNLIVLLKKFLNRLTLNTCVLTATLWFWTRGLFYVIFGY